jgi:hypothetical protein
VYLVAKRKAAGLVDLIGGLVLGMLLARSDVLQKLSLQGGVWLKPKTMA